MVTMILCLLYPVFYLATPAVLTNLAPIMQLESCAPCATVRALCTLSKLMTKHWLWLSCFKIKKNGIWLKESMLCHALILSHSLYSIFLHLMQIFSEKK